MQVTGEHQTIGGRRSTSEILTQDLVNANAPEFMIIKANLGHYDDFKSPLFMPIHQLVCDALQNGLYEIANDAKEGKYDAQDWETEAWAKSEEGQYMLDLILASLPDDADLKWQLL